MRVLTALQEQFRSRDTGKIYMTLAAGSLPARLRVIDQPLHKSLDAAGERHVRVVSPAHEDGRRSITVIRSVHAARAWSPLEICLKTGHTHQIRVHLSHAGHPIVGDPQRFARMFLHARELGFGHPGWASASPCIRRCRPSA